jgi:hypothetical protein
MQTKAMKAKAPQFIRNMRASCAAAVKQTAGRSRLFADKTDILATADGGDEIAEGIAAYRERREQRQVQNNAADLIRQQISADLACL